MVTPLAGYIKSPGKTRFFIFPLMSYRKKETEKRFSIMLFLARYTSDLNYSSTSILWPVCEKIKKENYSYFRFAPFLWHTKTDTSNMLSIQPVFYSYQSKIKKNFILFWFIYKHENIYGQGISNSFLWKMFTREKLSNGDFETRLLYLLYANVNKNGKRERSILPFYYHVKYPNGDESLSVSFGLYNYFKQYLPEIKEYYEEERILFIRLRSNYNKLKSEGKEQYLKRK